jgi:hypothetical protein
MKIESSVTSLSWIPSEAVKGLSKLGFTLGPLHYDEPLPDAIAGLDELEAMRQGDRFRFGNRLEGWIEVEDGRIVAHGQAGGGLMGSTTLQLGPASATFAGFLLPELRPEPDVTETSVTFRQTVGGCTGVPAPRPVRHKPFVQYRAPTVWTTLALTIHVDGRTEFQVEGASKFPRHWVYDADLELAAKSGLAEYKEWFAHSFGERTPWGDQDSPAMMAEVESALEREMSAVIMRGGGKPKLRKINEGEVLWEQGAEGTTVCLLLDGILEVLVDGESIATLGPGALIGERAVLEGGRRTATLRGQTKVRVAEARKVELDLDTLAKISEGHRREEQPGDQREGQRTS